MLQPVLFLYIRIWSLNGLTASQSSEQPWGVLRLEAPSSLTLGADTNNSMFKEQLQTKDRWAANQCIIMRTYTKQVCIMHLLHSYISQFWSVTAVKSFDISITETFKSLGSYVRKTFDKTFKGNLKLLAWIVKFATFMKHLLWQTHIEKLSGLTLEMG